MTGLFSSRAFDTGCRVEIEQSPDHFHAHVELDGNLPIYPGDSVRIHGEPIMVAFGEKVSFDRIATVRRAGLLRRAWTKATGYLEMAELYEVSFTPGRL
ncbi:hypothetical protein [Parasphingorhabdus sp.]|uniref:hypothetical protein n=1 Tax=Parasphingorhabdus sp. TaxID=2709688 RepID=UPI003002DF80